MYWIPNFITSSDVTIRTKISSEKFRPIVVIKIDIIIADNLLEQAIEAIQKSAHTGRIGDGKIFVTSVEQAVRIRTGETGDAAV